jgi:hypothetical protein
VLTTIAVLLFLPLGGLLAYVESRVAARARRTDRQREVH